MAESLSEDEMAAAVDLLRAVLGVVPVAAGPLDAVVRHRAEGAALTLEGLICETRRQWGSDVISSVVP